MDYPADIDDDALSALRVATRLAPHGSAESYAVASMIDRRRRFADDVRMARREVLARERMALGFVPRWTPGA